MAGRPARSPSSKRASRPAAARRRKRRAGRPVDHGEVLAVRREIVAEAARCFAEEGYARTRTAAIARAAGCSEGTLFHHFPTKRALLREVGRVEGARVLETAFRGLDAETGLVDPRILLERLFDYARERPDRYRLFVMDGETEDLESGFGAKQQSVVAGLEVWLSRWVERGELREMDCARVARLVFAIADSAVRRLVLEARWDEATASLDEASFAIRALLAPDRPPERALGEEDGSNG
ncbi:MAG: TetR/AcrR family transcriptional regulator [Myxococcota bacterium]